MNILVTMIYDLGKNYSTHKRIHDLSLKTYEGHLQNVDDIVTLEGAFERAESPRRRVKLRHRAEVYGQMFAEAYWRVQDLWGQGNNVFWVDADTLCVRETPWPRGRDMRLFNMANATVPYELMPETCYLHGGVRYFPATMDGTCWEMGDIAVELWDHSCWAYDQLVWNLMFWSQESYERDKAQHYVDPRYCWCDAKQYDNLGVPREKAYIVHYHQSRGPQMCLKRMRQDVGL